jgi:hypothetical protein
VDLIGRIFMIKKIYEFMVNRRDLLTGIVTTGVVGIAGCSGNNVDDDGSTDGGSGESSSVDDDSSTDGGSGERSSADDGGSTDGGSSESSNSSTPETVTRRFWEALINEDYETANELLHSGSLNYPLDESDISIPNMELDRVGEVTYEEASDRIALASKEEFDEAIQDRTGATDYTLVYVEFSDNETVTPVVEDDGELQTVYLR